MKIIWLSIIPFFIILTSTTALNITCEFYDDDFEPLGDFYTCSIEDIVFIASENTAVTFGGSHDNKTLTNNDVRAVKTDYHKMIFFPQFMEKSFKMLEVIYFNDGPLSKITQKDLEPFPLLRFLDLYDNKLEVIESNLFVFNPNLQVLFLSNNQIYEIHPNVFEHLHSLRYMYLSGNICIGQSANIGNSSEVFELVKVIKINCAPGKVITSTTNRIKILNVSDTEIKLFETAKELKEFEIEHERILMINEELSSKLFENEKNLEKSTSKFVAIIYLMAIAMFVMVVAILVGYIKNRFHESYGGPIVRMNRLIV